MAPGAEGDPAARQDAILAALARARAGDPDALGPWLEAERPAMERMVRLRLSPDLRGRLDVHDVVQEAYLEITRRAAEYLADPKLPFTLWMRLITGQKVAETHRRHLGARRRDPRQEVPALVPPAGSEQAAWHFADTMTGPATAVARDEMKARVVALLEELDPTDREVLVLRHFEELGNKETALELGISPEAASKRYIRALQRLTKALGEGAGGTTGGAR